MDGIQRRENASKVINNYEILNLLFYSTSILGLPEAYFGAQCLCYSVIIANLKFENMRFW